MTERPERFDPRTYETGWRERWEADDLYRADDDDPRDKHYLLTMYPYPSGDLHIGHWLAATGPDIVARMRRMQGLNVMFPMGFDSFGLPAENAAIDRGVHPAEWTKQNIERMRIQFRSMGCGFDWSREVLSSDPAYYRWTQWLFLQFFKAGLAYRAMAPVDWCPKDQVVLAREQVEGVNRVCWRCGTPVTKRDLEQWFFRITRYADELLDFSKIDWPEPLRLMQTNWIGRSEGAEIDFGVEADGVEPIRVFTTRPDTVYGATFMVLAPEHAAVAAVTTSDRAEEVQAYTANARRETEIERMSTERDRSGIFTGAFAIHPLTDERIPIWIADYVLPGYGTGAVMGVPAHDDRDYAFAKRYDLPVRYVIVPRGGEVPRDGAFLPHTEDEVLVDSGDFTGMAASDAIPAITEELAERGQGSAAISYRIRDWLISRQRYWGAPIPIVYCDEHGPQPLPEDQLPVILPRDVDFAPTGVSPLQSDADFLAASCPVCAGPARRETDTMDTFVDSSWYFLRYCSPHEDAQAWDPVAVMRWMPVDLYTGGAEHAVLHFLYARFFIKALRDMHHVDFDEPFMAVRNQGQILGADHHRMSKSRGNVVNPDDLTSRFGSDTVRCFLMFIGPWDQGGPWNPSSIEGVHRFLGRVWAVAQADGGAAGDAGTARELRQATHRSIKEVGEDYAEFHFNTALSKLMELTNALGSARDDGLAGTDAYAEAVDALLLLLAPMAPHITEELWSRRGRPYSIHQQAWPSFDPALVASDMIELPVQVDGKLRDRLTVKPDTAPEEIERLALASERVQAYLKGRAPQKVVQIPGRLVNIVTPTD